RRPGHRRPVRPAGPRAGPGQAAGPPAPDPAAGRGARALPAAVHAELPQRRGAAGGRVEPGQDPAALLHGPVRGRAAHGAVMDFARSDDERAFAEEIRGFLRAHPPERFALDGMDAGYGSGPHSREFMAALGRQGWLSMCWPRAHGGAERPMFHKLVLMEELA